MNKNNNKGFTLVELLAVISLLVIIVSVSVPTIINSLKEADAKLVENYKKGALEAAETYYESKNLSLDNGPIFIGINKLITDGYFKEEKIKLNQKMKEYKEGYIKVYKGSNNIVEYEWSKLGN